MKRSAAEGAAKRYNREQAKKAPLLAWAGLTPTTTADAVLERAQAREAQRFYIDAEWAYAESARSFLADWHRYVVWTLVELEAFEITDLMDEDSDRWQELDRSICDHRNTFPYGTKQHDILQEMSDFLTST